MKPRSLQDFIVGNFVLPLDIEEFAEAAHVKVVELFRVSSIDSPSLTGIQMVGKNQCPVDLQLGLNADSSTFLDLPISLPKVALAVAILFC